jgi:hypothetical protein
MTELAGNLWITSISGPQDRLEATNGTQLLLLSLIVAEENIRNVHPFGRPVRKSSNLSAIPHS